MGNTISKKRSGKSGRQEKQKETSEQHNKASNDAVIVKDCVPVDAVVPSKNNAADTCSAGYSKAAPVPVDAVIPIKNNAADTCPTGYSKAAPAVFPIVDPAEAAHLGLPYELYQLGPPTPPCDEARIKTARALSSLQAPCDAELDNILQLICNIMNSPAALIALFDDREIFCRNAVGFKKGDFPWRWSFCAWTLQPPEHTTFIVEDVDQDVRFKDNPAAKALGVKFYCGSPLVASNGHRLGSLCFVDSVPRKMDACKAQILNNFAELVVRELEKDIELQLQTKQHDALKQVYGQLQRAMDCFHSAVLFVDTSVQPWTILHCNLAWTQMSGLSHEDTLLLHLWELFLDGRGQAVPWQNFMAESAANSDFKVNGVRLRMGFNEKPLSLAFRPAGKEALDTHCIEIGVPSFTSQNQKSQFYFVTVTTEESTANSIPSNISSSRSSCQTLDGLELGALLGTGVHGRVYFGTWYGTDVAIKVIDEVSSGDRAAAEVQKCSVEAALGAQLSHPNIVRSLFHCTLPNTPKGCETTTDSSEESVFDAPRHPLDSPTYSSSSSTSSTIWVVMEFCDRGTLQDAVDKGWLRSELSKDAPPNMAAVLVTACEIASAMAYLHDRGIVHGDLNPYNVLLCSSGSNVRAGGRDFMAKVADFGLSREIKIQSKLQTQSYGTITHMPPELLLDGVLSKATDVFSFGVMLWALATGSRPWAGLSHGQVIHTVTSGSQSLTFPSEVHPELQDLSLRCMSRDPDQRPNFAEITSELEGMLEAIGSDSSDSSLQEQSMARQAPAVGSNSCFFQSL